MCETRAPHVPVLLRPLLEAVAAIAPISGRWLDGTFGAGGYTRALLDAGAGHVIGLDRDPLVFDMAQEWAAQYGERLTLVRGLFSQLDEVATDLDGVVLDLGVSSMQLDQSERGFSFLRDGPLDMRMSQEGRSAADLVNEASAETLADILYLYGEERASRRIARAIVKAREGGAITRTAELAALVEGCLPPARKGQAHPATRSFQALRIAVNAEFTELAGGLLAAERALKPGGVLAVVSFHSLEDRMVKRFFQLRSGSGAGQGNRYAPPKPEEAPLWTLPTRKGIGPDDAELEINPRARSARLRLAIRSDAPHREADARALGQLGMPMIKGEY